MSGEVEPMDEDGPNVVGPRSKKRALVAAPVKAGSSGVGLPYAPEDWPLPGDKWSWKVSRRITVSGYFHDRFLIPPPRFPKSATPWAKGICSRVLAEQFVTKEIPGATLEEFWGSFIWKIPASNAAAEKGSDKKIPAPVSSRSSHVNGHVSHTPPSDCGDCKVGNKMCHLRVQARKDPFPKMACDICCTESFFCRDCSCILCGSIIDSGYGGYGFMRCESIVENEGEKFICGHVAHMDCAFRAYLAGTIGGNVGLDAEYYCRRCDNRTDLVSYLSDLVNSTKALNSRDDVEKILSLSSCLLRGSQKLKAKSLQARLEKIVAKLRDGFNLDEIWKVEDNIQTLIAEARVMDRCILLGVENGACCHRSTVDLNNSESLGVGALAEADLHEQRFISSDSRTASVDLNDSESLGGGAHAEADLHEQRYISSDSRTASLNLENAIDNALHQLKTSQDLEYRLAEEKLYAQKDFILQLYQELEAGRKGLANPAGLAEAESESLMTDHLSRVTRIQQEEAKLNVMMCISKGFGRTGKNILRELYGMQQDG